MLILCLLLVFNTCKINLIYFNCVEAHLTCMWVQWQYSATRDESVCLEFNKIHGRCSTSIPQTVKCERTHILLGGWISVKCSNHHLNGCEYQTEWFKVFYFLYKENIRISFFNIKLSVYYYDIWYKFCVIMKHDNNKPPS